MIDELHALVGGERGLHCEACYFGWQQRTRHTLSAGGLSATLGDWAEAYAGWCVPARSKRVRVIKEQTGPGGSCSKSVGYSEEPDQAAGRSIADDRRPGGRVSGPPTPFRTKCSRSFGGKKCLIFANRRADVEEFADLLNEYEECRPAQRILGPPRVPQQRDSRAYRSCDAGERPCSIVCSSTLELGIDVGDIRGGRSTG